MATLFTPLRKIGNYNLEQIIFFVTSKCNLRCDHCFYWDNLNTMKDLSIDEIRLISASTPTFHTMLVSGGEPFLRKDLFAVLDIFYSNNGVRWFSIPTAGFWPNQIVDQVQQFVESRRDQHLRINVSIDGFEETHDRIRGIKTSYSRAIETLDALRDLRKVSSNLSVGVTTVVMEGNIEEVRRFADYLYETHRPDTHNVVAVREGFSPDKDLSLRTDTLEAVHTFNDAVHAKYLPNGGLDDQVTLRGRFNHAVNRKMLRVHYDRMISGKDWPFPCVAGRVILVIDANGDLRVCELRPPVLSLREFNFDLSRALNSDVMQQEIRQVAKDRCFCTHGCFSLPSLQRDAKTVMIDIPLEIVRSMAAS